MLGPKAPIALTTTPRTLAARIFASVRDERRATCLGEKMHRH